MCGLGVRREPEKDETLDRDDDVGRAGEGLHEIARMFSLIKFFPGVRMRGIRLLLDIITFN